jgi:hypothetical protein
VSLRAYSTYHLHRNGGREFGDGRSWIRTTDLRLIRAAL